MNPWLALSLGLWLGQTPAVTPSLPPDADTQDSAALELRDAWERALEENEASSPEDMRQELKRLRDQVQALQAQFDAQRQEHTARTELVQQQLAAMQARAQELERLSGQRLELLEQADTWVNAADQALAVGELDVGDALDEADAALAQALQNASDAGRGQTVVLIEDARTSIARALEAAGRRDVYQARWDLVDAALRLRVARQRALDRPDTPLILP